MAYFPIGDDELGNDFLGDNSAASLGRISGPLLKSNLERNGINLAFETNLLYIDVVNGRIGIRKDNPLYELEVNDTVRTFDLIVTEQATLDNLLLRQPNTISTLTGPIEIGAASNNPIFLHDILETSDLRFNNNTLASFSNADINLEPNGSGTVELLKTTRVTGDVSISGNIQIDGDLQIGNNLIVGDAPADRLTVVPEFTDSLIPSINNNFTLGNTALRWNQAFSKNIKNSTQAAFSNILIQAPATFNTSTGSLTVNVAGANPQSYFQRIETTALIINDSYIQSKLNANILFDPNGTGTVNLEATTNVIGDVNLTGNIVVNGDLSKQGNIIIGDQILEDTVTIVPDFTQSIIPGADATYDLGKNNRRWNELASDGWPSITNFLPNAITVSNQILIDGVNSKISATQSNEDIDLLPDTGITFIERTKWQDNDITNLNNTPITFGTTGTGYYVIPGSNGLVIPAGTDAERPLSPELGESRWNTQNVGDQYLESWDGNVWAVSTGGGETVTTRFMEDLGFIYSVILG